MTQLAWRSPQAGRALHFFKAPKGLLLVILSLLVIVAIPSQGFFRIAPDLVAAVAAAGVVDVAIVRWRRHQWQLPDGALLTGLIIAMVLRPQEPWVIVLAASGFAIVSKYALRSHWSNIFNPAALALVASSLVFATGQSWWGSLPDLGIVGVVVVSVLGLFIADRINKLPLVLVFLGVYFALFTLGGFFGRPGAVAEVFRTPDIQAVLFFAMFMLDDPPTCPIRYSDQIVFGLIAALSAYLIFMALGAVYFLPAGLLIANTWESARRVYFDHHDKLRRSVRELHLPQGGAPPSGPAVTRSRWLI